MKNTATLKIEVAGRKPGSAATVVHAGDNTLLLEDALGQFQCPVTGADVGVEKADPAPGEEEEPVARFEVAGDIEREARNFYDDYSAAVGGVAFNGDPLPPASEFFEDPVKQKQANAYRVAAGLSIDRLTNVKPVAVGFFDPAFGGTDVSRQTIFDGPEGEAAARIAADSEDAPDSTVGNTNEEE